MHVISWRYIIAIIHVIIKDFFSSTVDQNYYKIIFCVYRENIFRKCCRSIFIFMVIQCRAEPERDIILKDMSLTCRKLFLQKWTIYELQQFVRFSVKNLILICYMQLNIQESLIINIIRIRKGNLQMLNCVLQCCDCCLISADGYICNCLYKHLLSQQIVQMNLFQ